MNLESLQRRVREAAASDAPLRLRGGGTKDFYGGEACGELLDLGGYTGVVSYEPTELVVSARCGTRLSELETLLEKNRQCLPFEPPHFGAQATLGGCIAAGLSGPRRASAGAVRDFVLGTKLIDGRGRVLSFGGQVMKNVAGYDVSRLLAGSLGTLGIIAEVSLKILPRPQAEATLRLPMHERQTLDSFNRWSAQPLPISATAWNDGVATVRLSGAESALRAAREMLGGELIADASGFWTAIREQTDPFFSGPERLWRLSVPSTTASLGLPGRQLVEWAGALRWLKSDAEPRVIREAAHRAKGHATLFRAQDKSCGVFSPLEPVLMRLHRDLKAAFDPARIFNPGRLYPEL